MKTPLDQKIDSFEKERQDAKPVSGSSRMAAGAGRAGYEFLIATLFFAGIGFAIDSQTGTTPWITLALLFIGLMTGIYNAWRVLNVSDEKIGFIQERYRAKTGETAEEETPKN
jgi:F0F1-type ATP synthase assembly protein I